MQLYCHVWFFSLSIRLVYKKREFIASTTNYRISVGVKGLIIIIKR